MRGYLIVLVVINATATPARAIVVVVIIVIELLILVVLFSDALLRHGDAIGQVGRLGRFAERLFFLDRVIAPQPEEAFVHQEHAVLGAGLDRRVDAISLILADQV